MRFREVSTRDGAILRALDARSVKLYGQPISADQLKRWRSWRRVGLVPRSPERIRGYRTDIEISSREVRWIEVAAELFARYRSADLVALRLAGASFPLDGDAVKAALLDHFERVIAKREGSQAWAYRRAARGRGSVARNITAATASYRRIDAESPEPHFVERPVEAHTRHRRNVLMGAEIPKVETVRVVGVGEIPAAVTIDEARRAIVDAPSSEVVDALRATGDPEHAVDYLARGLVRLYREALSLS